MVNSQVPGTSEKRIAMGEMSEHEGMAIVRKEVALLDLVTRTWFEWEMTEGSFTRTLVVEVDCETDPCSRACPIVALDYIGETVKRVLDEQTTMIISRLRVVPKQPKQFVLPAFETS